MTEHVLDDLEAYALGALDTASAELVAAHLAACQCAAPKPRPSLRSWPRFPIA